MVICGASGSGKTTLLNLLGGLDSPTSGRVCWMGQDIREWSQTGLARQRNRHVAFVFQGIHLLPELDVVENILLPGWIRRSESRARAEFQLERVGLADRLSHRPYELSGGEQQRVAVARALYQDPAVILADEPTGNLDRNNTENIVHLLCELASADDKALLLVTHDLLVAKHVGQVRTLEEGRLM